jgi:hypothetical protein
MMNQILFGVALAGALAAQDVAPPPEAAKPKPPNQNRVFVLKYADANTVGNVLTVFGGVSVRSDRDMRVVSVSAPADIMPSVDEAINRLDVPAAAPKDIDLTVYLVAASEQPSAADSLLPELQPVATELKKIFAYKSFHLLDSVVIRTEPGKRVIVRGIIRQSADTHTSPYSFEFRSAAVTDDPKGRLIRLSDLALNVRVPGGDDAGIHTDVTVREGQRVVVGKSNMGPDQALILVLTGKVTE